MTQASTINQVSSSVSAQEAIAAGTGILSSILNTFRIISSAWEESRAEYKKHAILGGGWE